MRGLGTEVCLLLDAMTALCIVLSYPHLNTWLLRIAVVAVIACAVAVARLQREPSHHRIPSLFECLHAGPISLGPGAAQPRAGNLFGLARAHLRHTK